MIFFYDKRDNGIFACIDGRVHDSKTLKCSIDGGIGKENIGKLIVGIEETGKKIGTETIKEKIQKFIPIAMSDDGETHYKRVIEEIEKEIDLYERIEHNLDQFEIIQKFEDIGPDVPTKYKVVNNKLIKK